MAQSLGAVKGVELKDLARNEVEAARSLATAGDAEIPHSDLAGRLNLAADHGGYDGVDTIANPTTNSRVARDD
jgi:hypothetical protein